MSAPYLVIAVCLLYHLPPADSAPDGGGQCKKPDISTIDNMEGLSIEKENYEEGEVVRVQCNPGHYPSFDIMTCDNPGTPQEWTPPNVTCIAQCKKPDILTIDNMGSLYRNKEYYEKGEEVRARCNPGYYPSPDTMRCDNPGTPQEWTPPSVTCIGFTMTVWEASSTSISARISCTPQCPQTWRFGVECCPRDYVYGHCKLSYGRVVTFTNLRPSSKYEISARVYIGWKINDVKTLYIRTLESEPGRPIIVTVPSMEDKTLRWVVSDKWGEITRFQMNISARRDYNASFAVDESMEFPPYETEYRIPLQYGTNYTITLRAFTSAGVWKDTTENIETPIGDPLPPHMEKTSDGTLHFHPVLDLNGPIRSYEIIIFSDLEGNSAKECLKFKSSLYNSSGTNNYTAAILPAETLTAPRAFILGDDQHYNGFHNAPLIPNHNYSVYIRVTSHWNNVDKSLCAFAGILRGVTREGTSGSFFVLLLVPSLGVIIILLVLKLIALVGLFMVSFTPWMKQRHPRDEETRKPAENICVEEAEYVEA